MEKYYKVVNRQDVEINRKQFSKILDGFINYSDVSEHTIYDAIEDIYNILYFVNGDLFLKKKTDC